VRERARVMDCERELRKRKVLDFLKVMEEEK
jgi:hypothetical protein